MKRILFFLMVGMMAVPLLGAERSAEEAAAIAARFTNEQPSLAAMHRAPRRGSSMRLAHTCQKLHSTTPAYYVFNQEDNAGFVIVSADDRTVDVPMYAESGQFDSAHVNPNMRFWLHRLQEEISFANDSNRVDKAAPRKATTAIGPLLKNADGQEIGWYQETPYNNLCPIDQLDNTRCLTGCVATAAGMVMYMWRYPAQGIGSKSYTWEDCLKWNTFDYTCSKHTDQVLSADFGSTTYDWDNILPKYEYVSYTTAQANAVATLLYQIGVACEMGYGGDKAGGSGAYTDYLGRAMKQYFGYDVDKFVTTYSEWDYGVSVFDTNEFGISTTTLTTYFNADLEAGRPIIMGGEDTDGGHEFVCDGRNTSGYFHINWGWEGDGNCYCLLTSLKPTGYNYKFSTNIDALIGVRPGIIDTVHVQSVTVTPVRDTLPINGKVTLTATVAPANATFKQVEWSSDNLNVATVNAFGVVKGIGTGTATITATSKEGSIQGSATIVVTDAVLVPDVFTLVTNISDLQAGDEIILVGTTQSVHYGATNELTAAKISNYIGVEQVAIEDNTITLDEMSNVAIITVGIFNGEWTFMNKNGLLLGCSSIRKPNWGSDNNTWSIAIQNDKATITNEDLGGRLLLNYNEGQPRFSTYGTSTTLSSTIVIPQIYARSSGQIGQVVPVTGITMEQSSANMIVGDQILLYYDLQPATATNKNVVWSSSNPAVATVDAEGNVTALKNGLATITVTTMDGSFQASCSIVVSTQQTVQDTTFVTASQAYVLSMQLNAGEVSRQFYGVEGYVTVPNSTAYLGFWMDDNPGTEETFQGYNCKMPSGVLVLSAGMYVRVYGYIMNYNNQKAQIKDGTVEIMDTPTGLLSLPDENAQFPDSPIHQFTKYMKNGRLLIKRNGVLYDAQGVRIQ